jgi:hypothetical protein
MATCMHGWGSDGMTPSGCPQCAEMTREQDKEELRRSRASLRAICILVSSRLAVLNLVIGVDNRDGIPKDEARYVIDDLKSIISLAET